MKNNIKKQYNNFSDTYSENINYNQDSIDLFYEQFNFDLQNKKILDVGCGDGIDLCSLSKRGAVVYGIDPSDEFIQKSKKNNPTGVIKEGIAEEVPFSNEMFDVVISKWALQTSENISKSLSEISRILKPGGMFVLLSKHPWMQWMEKNRDYGSGVDYYEQKIVTSNIYGGKIVLKEPSHTMGEYLNRDFFNKFELIDFQEKTEFPASEQIDKKVYPTYFIIKARKK